MALSCSKLATFGTGTKHAERADLTVLSTFGGGNEVVVVQGFAVPEPASMLILAAGAGLLARRRKQK